MTTRRSELFPFRRTRRPADGPGREKAALAFSELVALMAKLRAPEGCPWDREQTHLTLANHLIEEAHEAVDAIDRGDTEALREELGDVLLQVVFHAGIAEEEGRFDVGEVTEHLIRKLIDRHPHVFGDEDAATSADVLVRWEARKHEHKGRSTRGEDIPRGLPALLFAHKAIRRLAGAEGGLDASTERVAAALEAVDPGDAEPDWGCSSTKSWRFRNAWA